MVKGLDVFRGHFAGYEDQYVLIGGTAATLVVEVRISRSWDCFLASPEGRHRHEILASEAMSIHSAD